MSRFGRALGAWGHISRRQEPAVRSLLSRRYVTIHRQQGGAGRSCSTGQACSLRPSSPPSPPASAIVCDPYPAFCSFKTAAGTTRHHTLPGLLPCRHCSSSLLPRSPAAQAPKHLGTHQGVLRQKERNRHSWHQHPDRRPPGATDGDGDLRALPLPAIHWRHALKARPPYHTAIYPVPAPAALRAGGPDGCLLRSLMPFKLPVWLSPRTCMGTALAHGAAQAGPPSLPSVDRSGYPCGGFVKRSCACELHSTACMRLDCLHQFHSSRPNSEAGLTSQYITLHAL